MMTKVPHPLSHFVLLHNFTAYIFQMQICYFFDLLNPLLQFFNMEMLQVWYHSQNKNFQLFVRNKAIKVNLQLERISTKNIWVNV